MNYYSIAKNGQIVRIKHGYGFNGEEIEETPMPTLHLRCEKCGWETKALHKGMLPSCICGGQLQTINAV